MAKRIQKPAFSLGGTGASERLQGRTAGPKRPQLCNPEGRGTHARGRFEPRGQLCRCQDDRVSTTLASLRNLEAILLHALQRCE